MSKPKKKIREKSKTRAWEQKRRNRLNEHFNKLWEALPIYDASKKLSKPDILINAVSTIKELEIKLKMLLKSIDLIKKLEDRVKKLLLRNEQLSNLLSKAGIKVPSQCGPVKKAKKARKCANAISGKRQEQFSEKELEKENQVKEQKSKVEKPTKRKKVIEKGKTKKALKKKLVSTANCVILVTQPMVQNSSCFILSKAISKINQTVITNSLLLKTPIVSSNIKPSIFPTYPQISTLAPGTLLFTNGTMLPIVPQTTILTNPASTLVVVTSKNSTNSLVNTTVTSTIPCNRLQVLRPKNTKTTQINKVPIPALTSSKYKCQIKKRASEKLLLNEGKKNKIIEKCNDNEKGSPKSPEKISEEPVKENKQSTENSKENPIEKQTNFCENILKISSSETKITEASKREKKNIENNKKSNYDNNFATESHNNDPVTASKTDINSIFSKTCVNSSTNSKNTQTSSTFSKQQQQETNNLQNDLKSLEMSELSNDIFASFQVAPGCQNPESTSPTAAFLLAFPLVSSGAKVTEVLGDENSDNHTTTPNLLQIGAMDIAKPTQNYSSESFTPNLLNFDGFSFGNSNTNNCGSFYNNQHTSKILNNNNSESNKNKAENINKTIINNNNNKFPNYPLKEPAFNENFNDIFSFNKQNNENILKNSYTTYKSCSSNKNPPFYTTTSIANSFYSFNSSTTTTNTNFNTSNYNNYNKQQNKPINWMTTPAITTSYKPDYFLPPFTSNSNTNSYLNYEQQDFVAARNEENQFSWSPNKIMPQFLDNHNNSPFVSTTLPTLVGDLALNNTPSKEKIRKKSNSLDNQTSFLSVSQLVEQNHENAPAKIVSRRSSGNRMTHNNLKANKRRAETSKSHFNISVATNLFNNDKRSSNNKNHISSNYETVTTNLFNEKRNINKNIPSSYSAEALIGNRNFCPQSKNTVPGFFNDMPYHVEQDNNYYQPTYQNNTYSTNFMSNNQDFLSENWQNTNNANNSNSCKKAKKRPLNDQVLPSFDIHFFSMPNTINSPILPDDFHTTYIPPTTLYSCKNPLYAKKPNEVNKPQMSPLINSAGTSLTNFNLSAIFPEINKESPSQFFPIKNGINNEKIEKTQNSYSGICTGAQYNT